MAANMRPRGHSPGAQKLQEQKSDLSPQDRSSVFAEAAAMAKQRLPDPNQFCPEAAPVYLDPSRAKAAKEVYQAVESQKKQQRAMQFDIAAAAAQRAQQKGYVDEEGPRQQGGVWSQPPARQQQPAPSMVLPLHNQPPHPQQPPAATVPSKWNLNPENAKSEEDRAWLEAHGHFQKQEGGAWRNKQDPGRRFAK